MTVLRFSSMFVCLVYQDAVDGVGEGSTSFL